MNKKQGCHEWKVIIIFPVTPTVFFSFSPHILKLKNKRPEEPKLTLLFLDCHLSQGLTDSVLLVIRWQRTPSPGLTVKGERNLPNAFLHSVGVGA